MAATTEKTNPKAAPKAAKPGDPAPAAKKEKIKRVTFPGLKPDAQDKPTAKLDAFPPTGEGEGEFNPKLHKPLRKQDFVNEAPFLENRAAHLEQQAAELRKQAAEARTLGSQADRAKAKKMRHMLDKISEIRAAFKAQGIDVDALMKGLDSQVATEPSK